MSGARRFLRDNGLSLVFGGLFLLALGGQALAGQAEFNAQQATSSLPGISLASYLTTADFATDVTENWQSEFLQFLLFILATVWLVQRGSPESKRTDEAGTSSDAEQKVGPYATQRSPAWARGTGWRPRWYGRSLGLTMGVIFALCWLTQSVSGWSAYNGEQLAQLQHPISWAAYCLSPDFWSRTLQNWQSEFLAVGCMCLFSVYLRQRGSPESKPVGDAHDETADTG